jgi:shikimate dehydrogenase
VVYALRQQGCTVWLANRSQERAQALEDAFGCAAILPLEHDVLAECAAHADGVVNCTSLGMEPHADTMPPVPVEALPAGAWVCDLVYRPLQTRLLQAAAARGLKTIDGLGMLVHQGALAFERWIGSPAPVEVMRGTVRNALGL